MNTTPNGGARPRPLPDDFEYVRATLDRCAANGHMPTVRRLAAKFPKRLSAHQRDVLSRTMRQYGRPTP